MSDCERPTFPMKSITNAFCVVFFFFLHGASKCSKLNEPPLLNKKRNLLVSSVHNLVCRLVLCANTIDKYGKT